MKLVLFFLLVGAMLTMAHFESVRMRRIRRLLPLRLAGKIGRLSR